MNIIDTNGVSYILRKQMFTEEKYYMPPDVSDEVELTEIVYGRKTPKEVIKIDENFSLFDENLYLKKYKEVLNKYGGRSFYNMTGFGDISIIATVDSILNIFELRSRNQLFDTSETIFIFTNDNGLINKIQNEFNSEKVIVKSIDQIK